MKLNKNIVKKALYEVVISGDNNSIVDNGTLKNIQIFGTEIELDLEISNPTLQFKKKLEIDCKKSIYKYVNNSSKIKITFLVKDNKNSSEIKGNPIPGVQNIIAISSGKGGVGKSTITSNLAVALADLGYNVGIIDADIYGPSMHIMFDLEERSPSIVKINGKNKIKPLENYNVKVLSIGFFTESKQAVVWRGPMASKALNQLIWDAHWGDLDYLFVDLPPGTGDIHLSLVQSIPVTGSVIVTTPQHIALADAKKGINMFQLESINVPVLGIVENMAYFSTLEIPERKFYIFGKEGGKLLSEQMGVNLLAEIPLVESVREASDIGRPAVLQGSTEIAKCFRNLASNIVLNTDKRNRELIETKTVKTSNEPKCATKI